MCIDLIQTNDITFYCTAVAVSGSNTEILQFDWFISGRIFSVLPFQEGNLKKPFLCRIKIKIFDNT